MGEESTNRKTIKYNDATDAKLQKLADKAGCTKREFFIRMVEYFHKTRKDPADISDDLLKTTLVKNHDTYIRFIRAQEEKILIPVKLDIDRMIQSQIKILDCFNNQILKANTDLQNSQQLQAGKFAETDKVLQLIAERMDNRESLKTKFLYILNQYIKVRDSFSFTTPAKEKEELNQAARQQVAKL
ncbi:BfmA/BtgA family mobilization protein [Mucilaginibacter rubeus]|uniref:Uncharacterized protein n=1 Tax=Mucilaginibacter rubeus TaxID=2027860 RepID=A0A5C1HTZ6_9SPHI|nr:BfmA/BtgA family mobilization protein [Mucilaginibacter rubeus]QEM09095.1 hypothetical protein DEO27_003380 [Mucilaginibacter rubeus]